MSQASALAAFVAASGQRRPSWESSRIKAEVNDYGDLAHVQIETVAIPREEALRFGRWLLAVFSDQPQAGP